MFSTESIDELIERVEEDKARGTCANFFIVNRLGSDELVENAERIKELEIRAEFRIDEDQEDKFVLYYMV